MSSPSPEDKARKLIDKKLEESGWTIIKQGDLVPNIGNFAVEEVQTDDGPMDYGLVLMKLSWVALKQNQKEQ